MDIKYSEIILSEREDNHSKVKTREDASESDKATIIASPAIRRMQNKTQVFPLETNAAIRNRLTHSLEVQQVGRYISRNILKKLKKNKDDQDRYGLDDDVSFAFVNIVEMSCLMHDIGNPPFGHFGEEVICKWIKENITPMFDKLLKEEACEAGKNKINDLSKDLESFDGNAQGIRIICTLQKLNLTYSQIASLLKYTRLASSPKPDKSDNLSYIMKKPGYYLSEEKIVKKVWSGLNINDDCRYPLAYIMEAADDISYGICDLEDSVEKDLLSFEQLHKLIITKFKEKNVDIDCEREIKNLFDTYKDDKNRYFIKFRLEIVNKMVEHVTNRYLENHEEIFEGRFNEPLVEESGSEGKIIEALKEVARADVFIHKNIETLELKGRKIICSLFDCYKPLLELSHSDFRNIETIKGCSYEIRLYHRLPERHINAYRTHMEKCFENGKYVGIYEFYYRVRLIIDFISGMTDEFAHEEFISLTGL